MSSLTTLIYAQALVAHLCLQAAIHYIDCKHPFSISSCSQELAALRTQVNPSQAEALHKALTQRVALIQGPPGMKVIPCQCSFGKSFKNTCLLRRIT